MSEKKAQAIYEAVHEVLMRLRVDLEMRRDVTLTEVKNTLPTVQHAAAMAAVAAYRQPMRKGKR